MVDIEKAIIARYDHSGEHFEILIDPKVTEILKEGKDVDLSQYLAVDTVFKDAKKGTKVSDQTLQTAFGTTDIIEVAKQILKKGQIQVTTEQRRALLESKKRQIITEIARNAINPQTGMPHPPQRIENAIAEAKVRIDPFKSVDMQIEDVLKAIQPLIPIRFEKVKIAVKLSGENYGKCYGDLKNFGRIVKEEWQPDGSWIGIIELPAGLQTDFYERLNARTKGAVETKVIR
jgi:ribosome maturation protein SDO1